MLSALWNLSAHSTENKAAICQVDGALGFLVSTLTYKCQSNSLAIIESGGGILRNVSSLIATREDYRWVHPGPHPGGQRAPQRVLGKVDPRCGLGLGWQIPFCSELSLRLQHWFVLRQMDVPACPRD